MTNQEMLDRLKSIGANKPYRPLWDLESKSIELKTKKPAQIVDGYLKSCEISLRSDNVFLVWTSQKNKAMAVAREHGIKVRPLDGEAELHVPAALADEILPAFGAKVKRQATQNQLEALKAVRLRYPNALNLARKSRKKATSGDLNATDQGPALK